MKDDLRSGLISKIKEKSDYYGFDHCKEEAALNFCEILIKFTAGYAVSYTEGQFLMSMPEFRNKNGKPSRLAMKFLCSVYYKHSNLKSDGCEWANKFRSENK